MNPSLLLAFLSTQALAGDITVRDSTRSTIGYVETDGTVRDGSRSTVGYLDGCTARDSSRGTSGYFDGCTSSDRRAMAAWVFFFSETLRP